jgi:hypothetical protein
MWYDGNLSTSGYINGKSEHLHHMSAYFGFSTADISQAERKTGKLM